jgi:hypothetical protein
MGRRGHRQSGASAIEVRILDTAQSSTFYSSRFQFSLGLVRCRTAAIDRQPHIQSPWRSVLKTKKVYSDEHAYNALVDLGELEMLITSHVIGLESPPTPFTHGQGSAAFWAALETRSLHLANGSPRMPLTPDKACGVRTLRVAHRELKVENRAISER